MRVRGEPLRRRLFLLAAAAILPLALMAGVGLVAMVDDQRRQAERAALEIARALSTAVDAELNRSAAVLEAIGTATILDTRDLPRYHELARRVVATRPTWQSILLHDTRAEMLLSTNYPVGADLTNFAEPESILTAARTRRATVGYLARGPRGVWLFPVRVPVVRDGEVRYVLSAIVRPDNMLEVVQRQRLPEDWVISVFDGKGQRVARSRQHAEFLGGKPSPTLQAMMARLGKEGVGLTQALEGDDIYTAFSTSADTGWTVAIGIPPSFVDAGASRSLLAYGGGVLLSLLLGALAALALARGIARPIAQLRAAAQALGRREPLVAPATGIREIRQVADSIVAAADERARGEAEREQLLAREQQARALAEDANRSKDEFLAMLGHELRNPLGAIANASRVLEQAQGDAQAAGLASGVIRRQVDHLTRLTDDLLDAGRAVTGKILLERQVLELGPLVARALDTLQATGRLGAHRVERQLASDVWVNADPTRMEQIVVNLVGNAVKFTPPGGRITVSVANDNEGAFLSVSDTGIGMSRELRERAFELFVQGDSGLARTQGGLGIGLTLVRRIAELHGGQASASSAGPGAGSRFTVRLPASAPPERPAAASPHPDASRARNIVIVEDNDDAARTLCKLLEMAGHSVRVASDGAAGLGLLREQPPEVALVDVGLPGMNGYELARAVRAGGKSPYLVALTGYGSPEDRRRALDAGFDEHMVKPVDLAALSAILERLS